MTGKVTRTNRFLPTVPSQDVSRYQAVLTPLVWRRQSRFQRLRYHAATTWELATRGTVRWWLDRAPWWLVTVIAVTGFMTFVITLALWIVA